MNTKEELFEFENQNRHKFDELYKSKGWPYKRIFGKDNKKYDCKILIDDEWLKIEEKYRSVDFNDLLVETIQDTKTNAPGWLYYTEADWIVYGVGQKFFLIDLPKLKGFVERNKDIFEKKISKKGWGITENIAIPWSTIIDNQIGNRIK